MRYKKLLDKERVHDFLVGLNRELDEVWGQILGLKPLPTIEEVFAKVKRDETQKQVMLGDARSMLSTENSALTALGPKNRGDQKRTTIVLGLRP